MELLKRRRILMQPKRIIIGWNNLQPPFSTELYRPYNASYTSLDDVETGIVKQTWLKSGGGYDYTTRLIAKTPWVYQGNKYYVSYMINPSFDGAHMGVEAMGGVIFDYGIPPANTWTRMSFYGEAIYGDRLGIAYFGDRRGGGYRPVPGDYCLLKSPIYVNLTRMFGAGNEPTLEEFERQCAKNGVDLTQSHPQVSHEQRYWII